MKDEASPGQRIDKWLWYARFFKTRSLAAKFVAGGKIRVRTGDTTARATKSSHVIRAGDILTFPKGEHIRVVRVEHTGTRRGPAVEAQTLYEDLAPPAKIVRKRKETDVAARDRGAGRPTKKERRAIDRLKES